MNTTTVLRPAAVNKTVRAITASALLALTLSGCVNQVPIHTSTASPDPSSSSSARATPNGDSTSAPVRPSADGKLNAANDDLDWANGQRLLGDEHGGYTPDFSNKMADPKSDWVMDASKISEGAMVFTSKTNNCVVRTYQNRLDPSTLVQSDDRATSANVLAMIFKDDPASVQNKGVDIALGYGLSDKHTVTLLAGTSNNGNGYFFTGSRAFSKLGVVLVVDSVCPTSETREKTIEDIKKSITINAN